MTKPHLTDLLTETQAIDWLNAQGITIAERTLKLARKQGKVAYRRLPTGRHRIRYERQDLIDAFVGERIERAHDQLSSGGARKSRPARPRLAKDGIDKDLLAAARRT